MSSNSSNNKQIAKNTIFLYLRMIFTLLVSFYTSRVILDVLGVEDYGIYNIVGGVVSILSFLNSSLSNASTRFLTFALGKKDKELMKHTFSSSLFIHIGLALCMLILLEIIGYWFVAHKLVIPEARMEAALLVFHFSVFTCVINVIQLPFNAAIIAHERMDAFAYISILDVMMKLIIVYALNVIEYDKLITYGFLVFLVYCCSTLIYIIYALSSFEECRVKPSFVKSVGKPIMNFSTWDLFASFSVVIRSHGLNILQNVFFGPIVNAATGLSNQVMTAIMGFAENFLLAVKPQMIKQYAENNIERFTNLIYNMSRYCTLLLFIMSFPVYLEIDFVLSVWLVEVPEYAASFCRLSIINNWISILYRPVVTGIYATGNSKRISIINGSVYLLVLPLSYVFLKAGGSPVIPFILNIVLLFLGHTIFSLKTMHIYVKEFCIIKFFKQSALRTLVIMALSAIPPVLLYLNLDQGWLRLIFIFFFSTMSIITTSYFLGVDKEQRKILNEYVKTKIINKYDKRDTELL